MRRYGPVDPFSLEFRAKMLRRAKTSQMTGSIIPHNPFPARIENRRPATSTTKTATESRLAVQVTTCRYK
jgi:hypothetical protein